MKITDGKTEQRQHSEEFKVRNYNATQALFLPMRLCICSARGFLAGIKRAGIRSQTGRIKKKLNEKRKKRRMWASLCLNLDECVCTLMCFWHSSESENIHTAFYKNTESDLNIVSKMHSNYFIWGFFFVTLNWLTVIKEIKSEQLRNDLMDESISSLFTCDSVESNIL